MLGSDLGKNSFRLVVFDPAGAVVLRCRVRRETIVGLTAKLPTCVVAVEARLAASIILAGYSPPRNIPFD